jgi:sugar phosphate isomerase/epimerase
LQYGGQVGVAVKLALSTNWCNRRLESGEAIVDEALALGFDALELGFRTSQELVAGFKARLDEMPVGSVHAFCPVPISAPQGHPELFTLASFDAGARALARAHVANNIRFAAEMGASAVVLHAGRVAFSGLFRVNDSEVLRTTLAKCGNDVNAALYRRMLVRAKSLREARGAKLLDRFMKELSLLVPVLEENGVTLALENLPYYEGFPDEDEMVRLLEKFKGAPVKAWFDTGHDRVRKMHGWVAEDNALFSTEDAFAGMHLNDVKDYFDDHLPPGEGNVDFASLKPLAEKVAHVVVEPSASVARDNLEAGLKHIRALWCEG